MSRNPQTQSFWVDRMLGILGESALLAVFSLSVGAALVGAALPTLNAALGL